MPPSDMPNEDSRPAIFCCSLGHEDIPATAVGVYDDGDHTVVNVPYCESCARQMSESGEWSVTRLVGQPITSAPCPMCAGSGYVVT